MKVRYSAVVCLALTTNALLAQGNSENVRSLNSRIAQLQGLLHRAEAAEAASIRSQAAPVFQQRAQALQSLIQSDPKSALSLAFSQELRDQLASDFPGSANALEQHGSWTGTSEHLIFDDPGRQARKYQVNLQNGNEKFQVYAASGEPHCVSGNALTANGIRLNNVVAAGSTKVAGTQVAGASCTTTGAQSSAVLLVNFPGISLPSNVTVSSIYNIFFGTTGRSVNTYWQEASYGKASATGSVFGPFTLDRAYSCDEYNLMRSAAIAAADATVNFSQYNRLFIVFPDPGGCGWAGLGTLGCGSLSSNDGTFPYSTSWLLATYMGSVDNGVRLATHEGGHNLTLHHASSRAYTGEALGPVGAAGTLNEYGDPFNTMGSWNFGHYNAPHKVMLGWLSGANVLTTETPGTYTIAPFVNGSGVQALKVRRGTGNNAWLWLEYRQNTGTYESTLNPNVFTGGLVHYEDSTTGTRSHLLDFTPGSANGFNDPALTSSWVDPYTNLSLSVNSATASGLSLNVSYGTLPCARVAPTVSLSPANPSGYPGNSVNYTLSVTNNDSLGCSATTFSLSSTLPSGWTTNFQPASLSLNPAQTLTATMTKNIPAGQALGTFAVDGAAGSSFHAPVTANANVTVVSPPVSLDITLTASPTSVPARSYVTLTATVTKSGVPVVGTTVSFRIVRGSSVSTQTAVTNSQGVATLSYRAQQKGSYTATASATSGGSSGTSNTVSFTAN
jgi:M6 family metalloprotease-like protein